MFISLTITQDGQKTNTVDQNGTALHGIQTILVNKYTLQGERQLRNKNI